jgi:hypothetical protein
VLDPIHGLLHLPLGGPTASPKRVSIHYCQSPSPVSGSRLRRPPPQGYGPDDTIFRSICQEQICSWARLPNDLPRKGRLCPGRKTAPPGRNPNQNQGGKDSS